MAQPHQNTREVEKKLRSVLRDMRMRENLTLREMSEKTGIPETRLSYLERMPIITPQMAKRIADAMAKNGFRWKWTDLYVEL